MVTCTAGAGEEDYVVLLFDRDMLGSGRCVARKKRLQYCVHGGAAPCFCVGRRAWRWYHERELFVRSIQFNSCTFSQFNHPSNWFDINTHVDESGWSVRGAS